MKILFSPQIPLNDTDRIIYEFGEDILHVTLPDGTSDTFDFSNLPDGELQTYDEDTGEPLIETELSTDVIISAKREEGILYVELLNYIGLDATEEERFPEWIDPTEYEPPIIEKEVESDGKDDLER